MKCPQCQMELPPDVKLCPSCKAEVVLHCSFCSKSQHDVRKLIAGPGVYVCDECIELCLDIIAEEWEEKTRSPSLQALVTDFARGLQAADARRPQAVNQRWGKSFMPGIGPHTEAQTLKLVLREMCTLEPSRYVKAEMNVVESRRMAALITQKRPKLA